MTAEIIPVQNLGDRIVLAKVTWAGIGSVAPHLAIEYAKNIIAVAEQAQLLNDRISPLGTNENNQEALETMKKSLLTKMDLTSYIFTGK